MKNYNLSSEMPQGSYVDPNDGIPTGDQNENYSETYEPTSSENDEMQYARYKSRRYMTDEMGAYYEDEYNYETEESTSGNESSDDYQEESRMNSKVRVRTTAAVFALFLAAALVSSDDLHAIDAGSEISFESPIVEQSVADIEAPAISAPSEFHVRDSAGFVEIEITSVESAIHGVNPTFRGHAGAVAVIPSERPLEIPAQLSTFRGWIHSLEHQGVRRSLLGKLQGVDQPVAHSEPIELARIGQSISISHNVVNGGMSIETTCDIRREPAPIDVIKTHRHQILFLSDLNIGA